MNTNFDSISVPVVTIGADIGEDDIIFTDMVFSCENGVYVFKAKYRGVEYEGRAGGVTRAAMYLVKSMPPEVPMSAWGVLHSIVMNWEE